MDIKKKRSVLFFCILLWSGIVWGVQLNAQREQIVSFHADLVIKSDATIDVVETIAVWSTGNQIKRGIVREIPTQYKNRYYIHVVVDFTLKSVLKEGQPVLYRVGNVSNGKRIEIGDDTYIEPGLHTYRISYAINRQIGFYDQYDELYWNVTGTGWRLPIARASACVHLPANIPMDRVQVDGYTGGYGLREKAYQAHKQSDGSICFSTTRSLEKYEGLTIVAVWPKGFITEPTLFMRWWYFIKDNIYLLWAALGCIILVFYVIVSWFNFRALWQEITVFPHFYPPEQVTPGVAYYIMRKKAAPSAFAAEIVSFAVQGFLTIEYDRIQGYTLIKKEVDENTQATMTDYQKGFLNTLFSNNTRIIVDKHVSVVQKAVARFNTYLTRKFYTYFTFNAPFIWRIFYIFGVGIVCPLIIHFWHDDTVWFIVFMAVLLCGAALTLLSYSLCILYTTEGTRLKVYLDGFKMFLEATEKERLAIIGTPPDKTPKLYETYLPYAMALGVEQAWSKQFAPVFNRLEADGVPYVPVWYHGHGRLYTGFSMPHFVSTFNSSFNSAISAAARPPGSGSGFGGRGYSGGGGGGGGGGGR